ncbi:MFS transporter [Nonomuraea rosea]|uniref:MFS transporter n=1 Tax=Nonomuraea rosea TaxID=638574 RepID=A0ABP6ZK38_9ACTN
MLKPGKWPSLILLFIYGVVATSLVTQTVPVVGDISKQFGLTSATSGWVISIPSLITAIAAVFGGWLIDRIGDKKVLLAGAAFALAGNIIVFTAQSATAVFAGRLVEGVGYLSLTVGAVTMIMRTTTGTRRAIALGFWTAHTAVGIGITLTLVAPLAGHGENWRWAFGGHAFVMAALVVAAFFLPGKTTDAPARTLRDIMTVLKSLPPYRVALASGASAFIQTGIMTALTVYLHNTFSVSIPQAAAVGTIAEVFVAAGCLSVGYLLKGGMAAKRIATVSGAVTLIGGMTLYLPTMNFLSACAAVCVFSLGIGTLNGLIWTFAPGAAPSAETLGATSGLVSQATYLGVLLGPPAIFASFYDGGWTIRIILVVVMVALQLIPLPLWRAKEPVPATTEASA